MTTHLPDSAIRPMTYNERANRYSAAQMTACERLIVAAMYAGFNVTQFPVAILSDAYATNRPGGVKVRVAEKYLVSVVIKTHRELPKEYQGDGAYTSIAYAEKELHYVLEFTPDQVEGEDVFTLLSLMNQVFRDLRGTTI
jgi:hypothetical protein